MKKTKLLLLAAAGLLALSLLPAGQQKAEAKKDRLKQLQLIQIALLLEPSTRPFKARDLATLRKAHPTVKADNPKLYKNPGRTEKILLLYMILEQIEHARQLGLPYVYLGYWIEGSRKMRYKTRFQPQEHLTSEGWVRS